jgi:hypothetical protein
MLEASPTNSEESTVKLPESKKKLIFASVCTYIGRRSMIHRSLLTFAAILLLSHQAGAETILVKLEPPQGAKLVGKYAAKGAQIYVCTAKAGANEWIFKAPEAELRDAQGQVFAKHYAGPSWEAADGSKIVGTVLANEAAPTAGAIPWLLLSAKASGTGVLARARFVQRLNTSGGVAPAGSCPTIGAEERVGYSADYVIYE